MKFDIKDREEFNSKYNGVSGYTMDKLVEICKISDDAELERRLDILKVSACGLLTLFSTVLPIYMLNNIEFLKQNISRFIIFGTLTPIALGIATLKSIKDYKNDNQLSMKLHNYFEEERGDIPLSIIEDEIEKREYEKEYNDIYKYSKDPEFISKGLKKIFGEDTNKRK